jgi:glycosyltransferase involved in cell wall biosynthesis
LIGGIGISWYTNNYLPLQQARAKIALAKADYPVKEHKPIVVLIASYNNSPYCERNLQSVFNQTYDNYRVIYIDDCSKDNTYDRTLELVKAHKQEHRFSVIHNEERLGAMANFYRGIHMCEPHEIVAILDGDDAFAHEKVLERLNQVYANPHVWLTYGQSISYPKYQERFSCRAPAKVVANNSYRTWDSGQWAFDHLRSFIKLKWKISKKTASFSTWHVMLPCPCQ